MVIGHWLVCACEVLGISNLDETIKVPPGLKKAGTAEQLLFIKGIAEEVVERMTLVDSAFVSGGDNSEDDTVTDDTVYNYARVLCHYGSLVMEFRDAWAEGNGDRMLRCWKLFMPHFKTSGSSKYALEALRLQFQTSIVLSPNLAHQVRWNRFVNVKGGIGRNIPCDLFNEHMNKLIKNIIINMGSNLTEDSLQRAARSVSSLSLISERFDEESNVPCITSAHSTQSDTSDIKKVFRIVSQHRLITPVKSRKHRSFPNLQLNPLHKWDMKKTKSWIKEKKKSYLKYKGRFRADMISDDSEENGSDSDSDIDV